MVCISIRDNSCTKSRASLLIVCAGPLSNSLVRCGGGWQSSASRAKPKATVAAASQSSHILRALACMCIGPPSLCCLLALLCFATSAPVRSWAADLTVRFALLSLLWMLWSVAFSATAVFCLFSLLPLLLGWTWIGSRSVAKGKGQSLFQLCHRWSATIMWRIRFDWLAV